MKFKSDIEVQAGLKDSSGTAGTSGKILSSTGTGVAWVDDNPGITGSGTTNYVPKFTGASTIGNSAITDDGTTVTLNSRTLTVQGNIYGRTSAAYPGLGGLGFYSLVPYLENANQGGLKIQVQTGGSLVDALTLNSSGNVGLGVTPSAWGSIFRTQQIGNVGAFIAARTDGYNQIHIGANSYYNGTNWIYTNNGYAQRYYQGDGEHIFQTAPSGTAGNVVTFEERMRIFSSGNVFIGSTPTDAGFKLDVNGTSRLTASANTYGGGSLILRSADLGTSVYITAVPSLFALSVGGGADHLLITSAGVTTIGNLAGSGTRFVTADASGVLSTTTGGPISGSGSAGQVTFWNGTNSITGESNLFWDSTNDRLGIGTTSPTEKLHLNNSTGTASFIRFQNTGGGGNYIGARNSDIEIYANDSERMRIFSNGNVFIGSSPTDAGYKLDVNGNGRFSGGILQLEGGSYPAIKINGGSTGGGGVQFLSSGNVYAETYGEYESANNGTLIFRTRIAGDVATRMRINGNGTVNISASISGNSLTVNGTANDWATVINGNTTTSQAYGLKVKAGTNSSDNSFLVSNTSDTQLFRVRGDGNVAVGNVNPLGKFQVTLPAYTNEDTDSQQVIFGSGTSGYGVRIGYSESGNYGVINSLKPAVAWGNLVFQSGGGNVLIGTTTNSGYRLDVNGSGRFSGTLNVNSGLQFRYNGAFRGQIVDYNAYGGGSDYSPFFTSESTLAFGVNGTSTKILNLAIDGTARFSSTVTATGFFNSSDIRLKEIVDYDYSVSDIKPISYLWKDSRDNKKHVGYSAQEVQKVMPDAVNEGEDGMLSVNYIEVLVAKIAELENRIKQLEK